MHCFGTYTHTSCVSGTVNGNTVVSVFSPDDGQTHPDLFCSVSRLDFLCAKVREYGQGAPRDVSPHLISNTSSSSTASCHRCPYYHLNLCHHTHSPSNPPHSVFHHHTLPTHPTTVHHTHPHPITLFPTREQRTDGIHIITSSPKASDSHPKVRICSEKE